MTGSPTNVNNLDTLIDELEREVAEGPREAERETDLLARLSELQQSLESLEESLRDGPVDTAFEELATAMNRSVRLDSFADAVERRDFDTAAAELGEWNASAHTPTEKQALAEQLNEAIPDLDGTVAESARMMHAGLTQDDSRQVAEGQSILSTELQQRAEQLQVAAMLAEQQVRLAGAKGISHSGGDGVAPSDRERSTWGAGDAGDPLIDDTASLQSIRQREVISGTQSDGVAGDRQQVETDELVGTARRTFQERAERYERDVAAALRSESLPLSDRQTIRRYFQAIRTTP